MTCENWPLLTESSIPSYVQIYDIVFQLIQDGVLKEGDYLPGENLLAAYWNVSRSTVRTAIRKLGEDGYLYKMQGKRTTVATKTSQFKNGLQWLFNPCIQSCIMPITQIKVEPTLQVCGKYLADAMGYQSSSCVMVAVATEYYSYDRKVASTFLAFHNKMMDEWHISLDNSKAIVDLVCEKLYQYATRARVELNAIVAEEGIVEIGDEPFAVVMEEVLIGPDNEPLAYCKHSMNANCYRFAFDRK